MDLSAVQADQAARSLARQKDQKILEVLRDHTGLADVPHDLIREHGACRIDPDGHEIYSWDECDLIVFFPISSTTEVGSSSFVLRHHQEFRLL